MSIVDRRIFKSLEAIKKAFIELMSEKNFDQITIQEISDRANVGRRTFYHHYLDKYDLLDKLTEKHFDELRELCESAFDLDFVEATLIWTRYFENNYSFFSSMLTSKGASYFRDRFLDFLMKELKKEADITSGKNLGLNQEVIVQFVASAQVGVVEWWFTNERPIPHQVLAEQLGILLERNL